MAKNDKSKAAAPAFQAPEPQGVTPEVSALVHAPKGIKVCAICRAEYKGERVADCGTDDNKHIAGRMAASEIEEVEE